jgi:sugar lactone lactonase YvrE
VSPLWVLFVAGCRVGEIDVVGDAPPERDSGSEEGDTGDSAVETAACDELAPLPLKRPPTLGTFTTAEDFTFNAAGQHVSVDEQGNLVGISYDGTRQLLYPGLGSTAGIHMLADGTVVYADVQNNTVVNLDYGTGDYRVIAAGLSYPNGLDVGRDGYVYVAETARGGLRRIDPATGESSVIALGMSAPNGVSFGPGWDDLYVGSFGGGVVYHLHREGEGSWTRPEVYGLVPEAVEPSDPCASGAVGSVCAGSYYGLPGECVASELGYNVCETVSDTSACVEKAVGDACDTDIAGVGVASICVEPQGGGALFCPTAPAGLVESCLDTPGAPCALPSGSIGSCVSSYEGALICYEAATDYSAYTEPCLGQELGVACTVADWAYPIVGTCQDGAPYGFEEDLCLPDQGTGGRYGGLDGLNVDSCNNVYATAYVAGRVYRWGSGLTEPELVADVRSSWIPNIHWGNGAGGWEKDVLYMADRDRGSVYALEVGVTGHGEAYEVAP